MYVSPKLVLWHAIYPNNDSLKSLEFYKTKLVVMQIISLCKKGRLSVEAANNKTA